MRFDGPWERGYSLPRTVLTTQAHPHAVLA
jgi:hypothetical protein